MSHTLQDLQTIMRKPLKEPVKCYEVGNNVYTI